MRVTSSLMMPPTGMTGLPAWSTLRTESSRVKFEPSPQWMGAL